MMLPSLESFTIGAFAGEEDSILLRFGGSLNETAISTDFL